MSWFLPPGIKAPLCLDQHVKKNKKKNRLTELNQGRNQTKASAGSRPRLPGEGSAGEHPARVHPYRIRCCLPRTGSRYFSESQHLAEQGLENPFNQLYLVRTDYLFT